MNTAHYDKRNCFELETNMILCLFYVFIFPLEKRVLSSKHNVMESRRKSILAVRARALFRTRKQEVVFLFVKIFLADYPHDGVDNNNDNHHVIKLDFS